MFNKKQKRRHIKVLNTPENDDELKKCQRTAYGFTNFGHFIARIRLHQMGTEAEKRRRQVGTIPCQVDTYKNENTIFLIRPNRGNIPPRFGHFF